MKIAQIVSVTERVPPRKYGGTQRIAHVLTEELVERGHDVTLFASGDSVTKARHVGLVPHSLHDLGITDVYTCNNFQLMNLGYAYSLQDKFDIIHDHGGMLSLPTANASRTPVVMTLHQAFNESARDAFTILRKPNLVSVSYSQRKGAPNANYVANIYHGLQLCEHPFESKPQSYLLHVGRIAEDKGTHHAIQVAKKAGRQLIIAAKLKPRDIPYFEKNIKPHIDGKQIQWVGEVDSEQRNELMKNAFAFLHPVTWPEPFGLTLVEAMACGCPVIAFSQGSIPEVVRHNKTGFVVNTEDEMVDAVERVHLIDRYFCSQYARSHFNVQEMVDQYVDLYQTLIGRKSVARSNDALLNYDDMWNIAQA